MKKIDAAVGIPDCWLIIQCRVEAINHQHAASNGEDQEVNVIYSV
jgi:hypothetical protein